ncbi:MAG: sulfite exporter TauE/SafE family protein [archaeon]|nr:sulfite exporter TauE/SafE family protein [archaeon]
MDPMLLIVLLFIAIGAGVIGALFGLGGGIVFVPVLTILFGLDATTAAAASLVGIVATSTGSATGYVKKGLTNIRLGMLMEITTTIGAIAGAMIAVYLANWVLLVIFSIVMLYSGFKMAMSPERTVTPTSEEMDSPMTFSYPADDGTTGRYTVQNNRRGMVLCTVAGAVSSMTGVGGGSIKVPLMNIYMHIPIKVASATSSYMIGITAFSGAFIYFIEGAIALDVAAAVAVGAYVGAMIGTRISEKVNAKALKRYMSVVFFAIAVIMILKAGGYM